MKIAVAQINPIIADINGNREKIINYIKKAEAENTHIIVFPELSTIGYPPMDLLENKKLIEDNIKSLEKIKEFTHSVNTAVVVGYADYDRTNSPMLFNSAAVIKKGEILFTQNKTLLPGYDVFDEYRYFSQAKEHNVFEMDKNKIGITICEDIWATLKEESNIFMEQRRYDVNPVSILAKKGANIIINLSSSPYVKGKRNTTIDMLCKTAAKYNVSIVYANQVGGNDSLIFSGSSMFIGNKGQIHSCGKNFAEDLLIINSEEEKSITCEVNDIEDIRQGLVMGLSDYMKKCGFSKAVLGLSGGIDSALTATIACEALGPENVMGITMPSQYSSSGSVNDSYKLAHNLKMKIETLPIHNLFDMFKKDLSPIFKGMDEDVTEENMQARIRGLLLMSVSNKTGAMVLSTGNKSEFATGYSTLYGDMCGGLAVISDLPKTLVYELSKHINKQTNEDIIPQSIINKVPSAELRPNQTDQDSLPPYEVLDKILELHIEQRLCANEIIEIGYDKETVNSVLHLVNLSEYKRFQAAPGLKVTSKAFGTGRRIPLAKKLVP